MSDEPVPVDTEALEKLLEIRRQQATVDEYLGKAETLKPKYRDAVLRRVLDDYRQRGRALAEAARPLRVLVAAERDKLVAAAARLQASIDATVEQREELELRRQVGELDEKLFTDRLTAPTAELEQLKAHLAAVEAQQERFAEALAGLPEAAIAPPPVAEPAPTPARKPVDTAPIVVAPPPAAVVPPPAVPPPAAAAAPRGDPNATRLVPALADRPVDVNATRLVPALADKPLDPNATRLVQPLADKPLDPSATRLVPALQDAAPRPALGDTVDFSGSPATAAGTQAAALPRGVLRLETEGAEPAEFELGSMTHLGRAEQNQVSLQFRGVSRQHAVIMGGPAGFVIKDLGSQNGTFVNGVRIESHPLTSGDVITLGSARLVFALAPPRAAGKGR